MHYSLIPLLLFLVPAQTSRKADQASAVAVVKQIQRADYEGDRAALSHLYEELAPFAGDKVIGSKVRYWRGFALWRRALNGFNESADHEDLKRDLTMALSEFEKSIAQDPDFVDAKAASASCLQNLSFLHFVEKDAAVARELLEKSLRLLKEAEAAEPENPRLLWVLGASRWYAPPERCGGQVAAIATYEKGLQSARRQRSAPNDVLTPSWGEPELLMNLAWSNLNRTAPDPKAAEKYAHAALELVPHWHYVRDILMPQIQEAARKQN